MSCSDTFIDKVSQEKIEDASSNEKIITPILTQIEKDTNGQAKLIGLEFKLKSLESLKQKITKVCQNENENIITWDILRYTFIIDINNFDNIIKEIDTKLQTNNIMEDWQGNYFCDGNIYKGLNRNYRYNAFLFEIQYHTEESFNLKQKIHIDYETYRDSKTQPEEKCNIFNKLVKESNIVKNPSYSKKECSIVKPPTQCNIMGGGGAQTYSSCFKEKTTSSICFASIIFISIYHIKTYL